MVFLKDNYKIKAPNLCLTLYTLLNNSIPCKYPLQRYSCGMHFMTITFVFIKIKVIDLQFLVLLHPAVFQSVPDMNLHCLCDCSRLRIPLCGTHEQPVSIIRIGRVYWPPARPYPGPMSSAAPHRHLGNTPLPSLCRTTAQLHPTRSFTPSSSLRCARNAPKQFTFAARWYRWHYTKSRCCAAGDEVA